METKAILAIEKIQILRQLENFLIDLGLSHGMANIVSFICACIALAIIIWLLDFIGSRIVLLVIKAAVKKTQTQWDDQLYKSRFFSWLFKLIAGIIILAFIRVIFVGYNETIIHYATIIVKIYLIYAGIRVLNSLLDAANEIYETKPQAKVKSIKGYIQAAKIFAYVVGIIWIIATISDKDPSTLFVGLGASAAIVSLIFKDTILGFIASIQVSAQDMVRPGDWIEMASKNADGIVTEINVSVVKVQNWDNTTTMIPIYSLISEAFTNWRYMQESGGRRFKRPLLIDIKSIVTFSPDQLNSLMSHPSVAPLSNEMIRLLGDWNTSGFKTNIGLFRCYVEAYLGNHDRITKTQSVVVRYLPITENGLPLEVLAYTANKNFTEHERVVSDIFEHIIIMTPVFLLDLYQRPKSS